MPILGDVQSSTGRSTRSWLAQRHRPQDEHKALLPLSAEYPYEQLDINQRSIRLLNLSAGNSLNPEIDCELIVVDVNLNGTLEFARAEYEALSWCWGTGEATGSINIRKAGRKISKLVSPDLVKALRALRHPYQDRYLWVDAVCINQDDLAEKNIQVQMMSMIYGQAKNVCV